MLDIVLPIPVYNRELVPDFIYSLVSHTDAMFRVIAVVDGGTKMELSQVQAAISGVDHVLLHNEIPEELNCCLQDAQRQIRNQFTIVTRPEVRLLDKLWVAKFMRIFQVDPLCGVVDTLPDSKQTTIAPIKRTIHKPAENGCRFGIFTSRFFVKSPLPSRDDVIRSLSSAAMRGGGTAWHHGGISYEVVEHKEHLSWRESSGAEAPSKSRSRTTRGSSSPTTTGADGPTGFAL